jgi:hypothetical protein
VTRDKNVEDSLDSHSNQSGYYYRVFKIGCVVFFFFEASFCIGEYFWIHSSRHSKYNTNGLALLPVECLAIVSTALIIRTIKIFKSIIQDSISLQQSKSSVRWHLFLFTFYNISNLAFLLTLLVYHA